MLLVVQYSINVSADPQQLNVFQGPLQGFGQHPEMTLLGTKDVISWYRGMRRREEGDNDSSHSWILSERDSDSTS